MEKITLYYCSCTCSEDTYKYLFENAMEKPGQQVQKYHRLFSKGFARNGIDVKMISLPPINKLNYDGNFFKGYIEKTKDLEFCYKNVINIPILKNLLGIISVFNSVIKLNCKGNSKPVIICDVLNRSISIGAVLASRFLKCDCIGIVTDLPNMLSDNKKSIGVVINNWIINQCTKYIFMTEDMNDVVNKKGKPYLVLEGHVDCDINDDLVNEEKEDKFICVYTGALFAKYGLKMLTDAFIEANLDNAELHIYGNGEYEDELREICKVHSNIKYYGVLMNSEIVKLQKKASLLINPRPSTEEFTKYSFPSKNMEYMLSGTPVLSTILPGMPKEYIEYIYTIDDETVKGLADTLLMIRNKKPSDLLKTGQLAKDFVLKNKNCIVQSKKVIDKLIVC